MILDKYISSYLLEKRIYIYQIFYQTIDMCHNKYIIMTIIQSKEMMCFSLVSFFVVGFCYLSTKQNYFLSLSIYICVYTIFLVHRNEHTDILLSFPSSFLFIFPYLFFSVVHRKQNEFIVPIDDKKEESICPLLIFLAS